MFYVWDFTLPKNRVEATRTRNFLQMERGTITRCEIMFPSGCCGLVFCYINYALHQVYPKNPDHRLSGNGETIVSSDEYELNVEPYQLEFHGWNEDEIYNHTITVRIQLLPKREITRYVIGEIMKLTKLTKPF